MFFPSCDWWRTIRILAVKSSSIFHRKWWAHEQQAKGWAYSKRVRMILGFFVTESAHIFLSRTKRTKRKPPHKWSLDIQRHGEDRYLNPQTSLLRFGFWGYLSHLPPYQEFGGFWMSRGYSLIRGIPQLKQKKTLFQLTELPRFRFFCLLGNSKWNELTQCFVMSTFCWKKGRKESRMLSSSCYVKTPEMLGRLPTGWAPTSYKWSDMGPLLSRVINPVINL